MMVPSLLNNFCTNLVELIWFGKLTIECILRYINLQQFLKGKKADCKQFFITLPILTAMYEMALVLPGTNLFLGWMYWSRFQEDLSLSNCLYKWLTSSEDNLRKLHKIWDFEAVFLISFFFLLLRGQICFSKKTFVPSSISFSASCIFSLFTWTICNPRAIDSSARTYKLHHLIL